MATDAVESTPAALQVERPPVSGKPYGMVSLGESDLIHWVLGVIWNPETDPLGFRVTVPESIPDTRREQLSAVASWYDPLGVANPSSLRRK